MGGADEADATPEHESCARAPLLMRACKRCGCVLPTSCTLELRLRCNLAFARLASPAVGELLGRRRIVRAARKGSSSRGSVPS